MNSRELREAFLDYFRKNGHAILPSSSLVPDDPTLLFTGAGMVQFKDIFWGKVLPKYPRVATCQKCFRTTDIDRVGITGYHHTFFEMLGNFSFGDYFKEGSIELAWRFLTAELSLPPERLWVSVYEEDDEAYAIWRDLIGIPQEKIVRLGKEENWWGPVGDQGPCGPDSEIYWDWGTPPCSPDCKPGCGCGRFSEIWNLVFTEYEAAKDATLRPLQKKNIDTGMGLERMTAVLEGVQSNFETDLFRPIIDEIKVLASVTHHPSQNLIADHIRAVVFLIADGVLPDSEESRGSVLRKVFIRMFQAADSLNIPTNALSRLVDPVITTLGDVYPEIKERRLLVERVIRAEAETYRRRRQVFERLVQELPEGLEVLSGKIAFKWYDTYGIPRDFITAFASEWNLPVDWKGFEEEMEAQRVRSRKVVAYDGGVTGEHAALIRHTSFIGYETLFAEDHLAQILDKSGTQKEAKAGEFQFIFASKTPFYAEAGGQIADTGWIENLSRPGRAEVLDVQKSPQGTLHKVRVLEGEFRPGDRCRLVVDEPRRKAIQRAHTATHLLHAALRKVLGEHAIQAGSWVGPDELRFDFTHFSALSEDELARVEELAFTPVLQDLPVHVQELPLAEAKAKGAIAHFEEEYRGKEVVRVVAVPGVSMELCGGTHVVRTGEIGPIAILTEEGVAAGTRRIRAVVGGKAKELLTQLRAERKKLSQVLGVPEAEVLSGVERIRQELVTLHRRVAALEQEVAVFRARELLSQAEEVDGVKLLGAVVEGTPETVKRLADRLGEQLGRCAIILGTAHEGRGYLVAKVVGEPRLSAGELVRVAAIALGGSGGGRSNFAQGGGPNSQNLPRAIAQALSLARRILEN